MGGALDIVLLPSGYHHARSEVVRTHLSDHGQCSWSSMWDKPFGGAHDRAQVECPVKIKHRAWLLPPSWR
jgi:hypothetical protein